MQTEIEKYDQINKYLKGQLPSDAHDAFELEIANNPDLASEIEMHKMVNEAIVDNYLIGIKASTRKVIAHKSAFNRNRNIGLGLGSALLIGTIYFFSVSEKATTKPSLDEKQIIEVLQTKPDETQLNQTKEIEETKTKPQKGSSKVIQEPTKPNFTIESKNEELKSVESEEPKNENKIVEIVKKEEVKEPIKEKKMQEKASVPITEEKKPIKEELQLILNLARNEQLTIPMDENFSGEFLVFGQDGNTVYQLFVRNGYPNLWDGYGTSGPVSSGQYGFMLKTENGQILKHGFITVIK